MHCDYDRLDPKVAQSGGGYQPSLMVTLRGRIHVNRHRPLAIEENVKLNLASFI